MITLPNLSIGAGPRLVLAVAVALVVVIVAIASTPALLVLPFAPGGADRADKVIVRLKEWTAMVLAPAKQQGGM